MISYIKGKIIYKKNYLIIANQGLGYKVNVPENIILKKKVDEEIELYLHQHLREDASDLYGFAKIEELDFFESLISVSGVGPKSALAILSRFKIDDVKKSIVHGDISLLTKVSGIGRKTAERIILELKSKMDMLDNKSTYKPLTEADDEIIDALLSLGYSKPQAVKVLTKVDAKASLEEKIKQALKNI